MAGEGRSMEAGELSDAPSAILTRGYGVSETHTSCRTVTVRTVTISCAWDIKLSRTGIGGKDGNISADVA